MAGINKPPQMKIKWLKRLELDFDDDDSSDATPQRTEPEKADKKQQKKSPVNTHRDKEGDVAVEITNKKRTEIDGSVNNQKHKPQGDQEEAPESRRCPRKEKKSDESKHQGSQNEKRLSKVRSLSAVKTMGEYGEIGGKRKGREGKVVQRKRSHDEMIAKEKTNDGQHAVDPKPELPGDPAKATAAARRLRRMRKLQARRKATGEHNRLAAVKLKRHESLQSTRLQRNQREQMRRTGKANANIPGDLKDEIVPRPRPRPPLNEEAKERKREHERQRRAAVKAKKEDAKESKCSPRPLSASLKSPNEVKRQEELRRLGGAEPCVVSAEKAERSQKRLKMPLEKMGASIGASEETAVQVASKVSPAKSPSNNQSKVLATRKSKVGAVANLEYSQNARQTDDGEKAPNSITNSGVESEVTKVKPCSDQDDAAVLSGCQGQQEPKQDLSRDQVVATQEEGQVCSPAVVSDASGETTGPQSGNEKDMSDEKKDLLLDMMPIPRKSLKRGPVTENAASFVIPKRPAIEQAEVHLASQAPDPLNDPTPVLVKPPPSPTSSPQLSGREPLRLYRRRTKNPVPVSKSTLSAEDRALMRLSRKRNSILMAAAELVSQSSTCDGLKKMSTTCMMGYEVLGIDGKALPDLIPRLSSATKREMASDKTVFAASFFGVSLSAPKAKGETASTVGECIDDEEVRKISCYEELLFERPEDRAFYQQRMYGTSFAPQRLRGRTTLIVRRARFERKSTGIRFNQDRDREEFAASLSKRYAFNKSVPRCNIPRENWQKLTRNQPSTVYLHYYNREDAEQASHVFHDDCGNPLELKLDYKAGVVISRCSSPAAGGMLTRAPRRSCSSERIAPEPSPLSSHNDSARGTPYRHRETQRTANSDYRYARYDRPSPAQFNRGRDRYGVSAGGDKWHGPQVERRSRSRSRPRSFYSERQAHGATGTNAAAEPAASTSDTVPVNNEDRNGDNQSTTTFVPTNNVKDGESSAKKAALTTSPQRTQSATIKNDITPENATGSDEEGQEEGEIETSAVDQQGATVNGGRRMLRRSPPRHWQQSSDRQARQQQDRFRGDLPIHSRERAGDYMYRPYENHNRDSDRRRSRSRSRPRPAASAPRDERGRDGRWNEPYFKERRHSREFGPIDFYDDNERRSYSDNRGQYGGRDYRDGGDYDGRGGGAYSRQY